MGVTSLSRVRDRLEDYKQVQTERWDISRDAGSYGGSRGEIRRVARLVLEAVVGTADRELANGMNPFEEEARHGNARSDVGRGDTL